jgi:catechol 2,3-dioxygenase-like lactoylglutathione lyase family enzyme
MKCVFTHVNICAADWRRLSRFYQDVFGCVPVPPERDLTGAWLDTATGVPNAHLRGEHLLLPGFEERGPTLEIFSYDDMLEKPSAAANRLGLGHTAFQTADVPALLDRVIAAGGRAIGSTSSAAVPGKGVITVVYAADPEGNLIEIQSWSPLSS